jgi:hypothetical protein
MVWHLETLQFCFRDSLESASVIPDVGGNNAVEEARDGGIGNLFRARLEQIINRKHELVQLADRIDWDWIDRGHAPSSAGGGMRVS